MKGMRFLSWAWSSGTSVEGALLAMGDNVLLWCVAKMAFSAKVLLCSSFDLLPKKNGKKVPVGGRMGWTP
jgi:hypothetical protein